MTSFEGRLTPGQVEILQWVGEGCPPDVMEGDSYRISASAIKRRGLITVKGRGPSWSASITASGRAYLRDGPTPSLRPTRRARDARPTPLDDAAVAETQKTSPTQQLVDRLLASEEGRIRVPIRSGRGGPTNQHRILAAQRDGRIPSGKQVRTQHVSGGLEIVLEDQTSGVDRSTGSDSAHAPEPVPVVSRVSRPRQATQAFKDDPRLQEISRAQLPRAVRVVQSLAAECDRRGHRFETLDSTREGHSRGGRGRGARPHFVLTVREHEVLLRIAEQGVQVRSIWEDQVTRWTEARADGRRALYAGSRPVAFDANATGALTIAVVSSYGLIDERWKDGKRQRVEDRLAAVLESCEQRAIRAEAAAKAAEVERALRQQRWEEAMERAAERWREAELGAELDRQAAAWHRVTRLRQYCEAVQARHPTDPGTQEWLRWAAGHIDRSDPLGRAPLAPTLAQTPNREDLKPHLERGFGVLDAHGRW